MRSRSQFKSQRREDKRRKKRGMRVGSKSVFTILQIVGKRKAGGDANRKS